MSEKCGTLAGYSRHRFLKEPTCDDCKRAKRDYQRAKQEAGPVCRIAECGRAAVSGELCGLHRLKERRNGDPEIDGRDPRRYFWSKVVLGPVPDYAPDLGNCWLWTGAKTVAGYGHFMRKGRVKYVHRHAYEHMRAPIPNRLTIDHLCRVTLCVNPYHLEPVPLAENSRREMEARLKELTS